MIAPRTIYYFFTLSVALHLSAAVVFMDRAAPRPSARQLPFKPMQVHLVVTPATPSQSREVKQDKTAPRLISKPDRKSDQVNKPKPRQQRSVQQKKFSPGPDTPHRASAQAAINKRITQKDTAPVVDEAQLRNQYLAQLLAHIDTHKYYPRMARRWGLEGVIQVSFTLLPGGEISQLQVAGDNRILCQAANATVRAALPMPLPPEGVPLPMSVSFGMQYRLN
ncbi:MAG: TonB family protein [Proteobacteria bacterium]|jgi:protein TonB|nr:TonB family protein [Pseudomonadota bacterium]